MVIQEQSWRYTVRTLQVVSRQTYSTYLNIIPLASLSEAPLCSPTGLDLIAVILCQPSKCWDSREEPLGLALEMCFSIMVLVTLKPMLCACLCVCVSLCVSE